MIAPPPVRLGADTPEDALAICLDELGEVHLPEVARLLGVEEAEARSALGTLVFDEPGTGRLVPAAEYLSGNVRAKLALARRAAEEAPNLVANVVALAAVLPGDLGPGEIEARLGASWVGASVVEAFLQEVLDDPGVRVEHAGGSEWAVQGGRYGVAATSTWGTARRPAGMLAESLLRQSPIEVHDQDPDGKSVPNPTETVAARDKAERLAERFSEWCWEEPRRAKALAEVYNERFNSIVLRSYEGARPSLPGLALSFEPRTHQVSAVARMVGEPAVLLAHEVGAGKTAAMAMGAMELRRLGLVSKPCFVVPNHMLEQWSREWLQLYPRARLLVAAREDLEGSEARRRFVARAATGEWEGVVVSHSAFERIPLSAEARRAYLGRERERLEAWLARSKEAGGLSVKRLQRKLAQAEERLKSKLETGKADQGLNFEQMGVDYIAVDEAHLFKNLATASNIPGARIDGSQRAQDLDMKLDWLRRARPGRHYACFATATPVANSITEAYVMQRYLRPELLDQAGIESFDEWAATFAKVTTTVELAPDGATFRNQSRFARFCNVPELLRMFHVAADVKTAEDLGLPTPALAGGKPETVVVPASDELASLIAELGERAEAVRARAVDPAEDNMLKISSDGRAGALDLRLLGRDRPEGPTKLDVAAERVASIWAEHKGRRYLGTDGTGHPRPGALQLVFCDLGTPKAGRWNAYDELRALLVERRLPAEAVRFVHEATDDRSKAELFAACREGRVAVLVGSTEKMGVGTNVQARAVALHHLDAPWRPADVAQREGRVVRQGNQNPEVRVLRYVTESSFDTYVWQALERKARFVGQVMRGRLDVREIEDVGEVALSYAEVKALAAGDPRLIEQAEVSSELARLERLERAWRRNQEHLRGEAVRLERRAQALQGELAAAEAAVARRVDTTGDRFSMVVGGRGYDKRADAGAALAERLRTAGQRLWGGGEVQLSSLASLGGFEFNARVWRASSGVGAELQLVGAPRSALRAEGPELSVERASQLVGRLEGRLRRLDGLAGTIGTELAEAKAERAKVLAAQDGGFAHSEALAGLRQRASQLAEELASLVDPGPPDVPEGSGLGGTTPAGSPPLGHGGLGAGGGPALEPEVAGPAQVYAEYQRLVAHERLARALSRITENVGSRSLKM